MRCAARYVVLLGIVCSATHGPALHAAHVRTAPHTFLQPAPDRTPVSGGTVQAPDQGTLRVTVVDPSGAVIAGATVTVTSAEAGTSPARPQVVKSSEAGVAVLTGLPPGRYTVHAEFPGFDTRLITDVRVRAGENRQVAILPIQKVEASVIVGQDKQQAASDRRGTFGTTLTREEIEGLSDDPTILQQQLQDMAGPGAVIRIDGFEGSALPAKAQIRSIRISRDQFAAEFHSAGGVSIEIITQPGLGPIRYFTNFSRRNGGLSGRSPFVPVRGPEGSMNYGGGLGGALIKNRSSFNLNVFSNSSYETPNLNAALPDGTRSEALAIRSPRDNLFINGQVDYALTLDQTLRFGYNLTRFTNENLGIGGYDQVERAYRTENRVHNLRVQHFGPVGRRAFWRSRIQLFSTHGDAESATEGPTIRVNDAFTSGSAQISGGEDSTRLSVGSDMDYVRGRQSWRAGLLVEAGWQRSDASFNHFGTYTFDSLEAYLQNRASNYTRRIGDPNISYQSLQAGFYLQDDIRPTRSLTLSPGLRYEVQTHVRDYGNLGPRFGATWAPSASGRSTLRGSVGIFYDWLANGTYEQTLRVDGFRQQELNILNPAFPNPDVSGVVPPINRYLLGDGYRMPRITRLSAGLDQALAKTIRVSATYSYQRAARLARGSNLNAPSDGVRPDPAFRNIVEALSVGASRQHQVQVDANVNPGALLPAFNGPRISWKRTTLFLNYTLARLENNTDGPFSLPASSNLDEEWGPAQNDIRNRLNASLNNQIVRNLLMSVNLNTQGAEAYNLLTGRDDNEDGVFNDRPAGTGRNTLRATGQTTLNVYLAYQLAFGRTAALPPGIGVFGGGSTATVRTFDQGTARYRVQLFVQAQNLTNAVNYVGYSGTLTSPFYGRPTAVREMRKVNFGVSLNF